jgi:2-oxoglutarate dehydrogenase E2 component (dihydrolipoamide succinyltransferase)
LHELIEPQADAISEQNSNNTSQTEIRREILQELEQIQDEVPAEEAPQVVATELIQQDVPLNETITQHQDAIPLEKTSAMAEEASDNNKIETIADNESPFASPSVRKAMAEYNIPAEQINGSGKQGKILKDDIEQHLQQTDNEIEKSSAFDTPQSGVVDARSEEAREIDKQWMDVESAVIPEALPDPIIEEKPIEEQYHLRDGGGSKTDVGAETEEINTMEETHESEPIAQHQAQATTALPVTPQNNKVVNDNNTVAMPVEDSLERRVPMTRLRARIAERLVEAQQTAAILTTFNDVDLSEIIRLRKIYRARFEQVHGIKLGFMSFFVKAATEALKRYPEVNARIDGQDIIYQGHYDIGVAVSTERGLVVPIVRDTNTLGHAEIEKKIHDYAHRARNNQLELDELTGGTFSITNGGVFGSMLSTPIINPPQSAILGMHKIEDRPVALNGEVVIRPMMYLALSYDHRLIDGKTAVSFLVKIKELLEDPASLFLEL